MKGGGGDRKTAGASPEQTGKCLRMCMDSWKPSLKPLLHPLFSLCSHNYYLLHLLMNMVQCMQPFIVMKTVGCLFRFLSWCVMLVPITQHTSVHATYHSEDNPVMLHLKKKKKKKKKAFHFL